MEQSKNKKTMLTIIGIAILVIGLIGVTYAFFNYTRTGSANTIRVGRINFVTRQTNTINLTNLFPIDPTDSNAMNDDTKVGTLEIEIEGDTDYGEGIEYLVSSVNSNIYTSNGVLVPISLDVTITDLGTPNANYFTARESKNATIYKKLVGDTLVGDQMLLVGYIKPNTTSGTAEGIDGSITIKAYLDKNKILISDTYDGTESDNMGTTNSKAEGKTVITTSEWNALQSSGISFQVKVEANEGIWVNPSLEEIMRKSIVMDNVASTYVSASTGINFGAKSSDTNGKGVYMRAGTENDTYPIMYYRGAVEDNNVKFANKCWQIVRTTDTGGVKLIYNGVPSALRGALSQSDYTIQSNNGGFVYDTTESAWIATITSGSSQELSFTLPTGNDYIFSFEGYTGGAGGSVFLYKGSNYVQGTIGNGGGPNSTVLYSHDEATLTSSDVMKFSMSFSGATPENPAILKIKVTHPDATLGTGCDNSGTATQITLNVSGTDTNVFAFSGTNLYNSPTYNGYMYGNVYEYKSKSSSSTFKFGTGFTYNNGTYTLTSAENGIASTRHYTCFTSSEICDGIDLGKIYYVYYENGNNYFYIELDNGKSIEDALREMQTNTTNSNAKDKIETWYASNMMSYTNKIEDTIYCNDRRMATQTNGWVVNGGNLTEYLYYAPYGSVFTTYSPSLSCTNKNDAFTWKNGNGNQKLAYPVGMITSDEIMLAGGKQGSSSSFYLTTGAYYLSLSPYSFSQNAARVFSVGDSGSLNDNLVDETYGLRPVISLKHGTPVVKGTGTATDPYLIG